MGIYVDSDYVCSVLGYDSTDSAITSDIDALIPAAEELVNTYCGGGIEPETSSGTARLYDGTSNTMVILGCYLQNLEKVEFLDYQGAVLETPIDCVPQPTKNRLNLFRWIERRPLYYQPNNYQYINSSTFPSNYETQGPMIFPIGVQNIRITGTWGFPSIPEAIKLATAHTIKHIISLRSVSTIASAESGFGRSVMYKNLDLKQILPPYVRAMLIPYINRMFTGE